MMNARLFAIFIAMGMTRVDGATDGKVITDAEWGKTIDVAGRQRMLSQKMSKEFLLVAKGANTAANTESMQGSISLFDSSLNNLVNGNEEAGIAGAPTEGIRAAFQVVQDLWGPFKELLEGNVNTVRSNGSVNLDILKQVAAQNVPLLKTSNAVVGKLVDAAKTSGAATSGAVVNIAGRQRMLIQRMVKEALLIGHGVDVPGNVKNLKATSTLFSDSHDGIVVGAPWAGVPSLSKMCTLQQMREVSYFWSEFQPYISVIVDNDDSSESQRIASESTDQLFDNSNPLFGAMVGAVKLYVNDEGDCNPVDSIDASGWVYLLNNGGKQRMLGQKVSRLFVQISNNADVQQSKVDLVVTLDETTRNLRALIEGDRAANIPAPPTQDITDQLLSVWTAWLELQQSLQDAVYAESTDPITVSKVAGLSRKVLDQMNQACDLYVATALSSALGNEVRSDVINIAGRQRMLFQKMSKEAGLIAYGEDPETNWDLLNETRNLFVWVHDTLLLGNPSQGIERTTDVCILQQMKDVADNYALLDASVLAVARTGSAFDQEELARLNPIAFAAMNTAVGFYVKGSTPGSASCAANTATVADWVVPDEWMSAIEGAERLIARTEKASLDLLLVAQGAKNAGSVDALVASLHVMLFGSLAHGVPAPPFQTYVDQLLVVSDRMELFKLALKEPTKALTSYEIEAVMSNSSLVLKEAQKVKTMYIDAASDAAPTLPLARLKVATGQFMLVAKMSKEAVLKGLGFDDGTDELDNAIKLFESSHDLLRFGGSARRLEASEEANSISVLAKEFLDPSPDELSRRLTGQGIVPKIIPEREDLLDQYAKVDAAWAPFKNNLMQIRDGITTLNKKQKKETLVELQASMTALEEELNTFVELSRITDPYVPPPKPAEKNQLLLILAICGPIVIICFPLCLAVCIHMRGGGEEKTSKAENGFGFQAVAADAKKKKGNSEDDGGVVINM